MNTQDDLGRYIRLYLGEYLPKQRSASPRTVKAYRDALKLMLQFVASTRKSAVAELTIAHVDRVAVLAFLESIETTRGNSVVTRNHRLAVIRSFFRFVSAYAPEAIEQCAQILAIPVKRGDSRVIDYLTPDEIGEVLRQVPINTIDGRRDNALLRFLYNTGARVQEALDVMTTDLHCESPPHVLLRGKGRKERICPLWPETVSLLQRLLSDRQLDKTQPSPMFSHYDGRPLTRFGVRYILAKYVSLASKTRPTLARKNVHPHTLRHTTAMHLLQSGVDLNTIRCWLGHASVTTTNHYVEIDLAMKRRALAGVSSPPSNPEPAIPDASLLLWLEGL